VVGRPSRSKRKPLPGPSDWIPPPLPASTGLLTPVIVHMFTDLQIGVSLWLSESWWHPICTVPDVSGFEYDHGVATRRWAYNDRCLKRACAERTTVVGEHAGFCDLFVPVVDADGIRGVLVAGPFAVARPTSADILHRWFDLTGSHGRLGDTSFSRYVSLSLSTLTLDDVLLAAFERLVSCFAELVAERGDPKALAEGINSARTALARARVAERMGETARNLIGELTLHTSVPLDHGEMARLCLDHVPEHVAVGLFVDAKEDPDPLSRLLRRDAFRRACVSLALRRRNVVVGGLGDHGIVLLSAQPGRSLEDLVKRVTDLARRFGLLLRAGAVAAKGPEPLPTRYRAALAAAELALSRGQSVVWGRPRVETGPDRLWELRSELGKGLLDRPKLLLAKFNRYIEAVLAHSGYRLETTSLELTAGLERLAEPLLAGGFLDRRGFSELCRSMQHAADTARTVAELVRSCRQIVSDLEQAIAVPTGARQERSIRRALEFIREHLSEPLRLEGVARAAGFAPDHFSKLFKESEGRTFERYLFDQRIARAKQLLEGTSLSVEQVQRLSGFATRTHFHRAFKRSVGSTPIAYRSGRV
jgi:AraC-like DNA-binding protein